MLYRIKLTSSVLINTSSFQGVEKQNYIGFDSLLFPMEACSVMVTRRAFRASKNIKI